MSSARISAVEPYLGDLSVAFVLTSHRERDGRTLRDGRTINPHTELNYFKKVMTLGGAPFGIEITSEIREAKQFDTRAIAKRAAENLGRSHYKVARVAVPT